MMHKFRYSFTLLLLLATLIVFSSFSAQNQESSSLTQEQKDLDFADGLYQRGMHETAAQQYIEFIRKYPNSKNREIALFRQGESFYQLSLSQSKSNPVQSKINLIKARQVFQDLMQAFPNYERRYDALLRIGEISYKLGDTQKGLSPLQRVIKEAKDSALLEAALFYAGRCYEAEGKNNEAEQKYRQIRDTYPKGEFFAFSTYLLAELLAKKNTNQEAVNLLYSVWKTPEQYGLKKDAPLIEEAQLRSAQVLYNMDQFAEAAKIYRDYVKQYPQSDNTAKAKYGAAWAEYRQGNDAQALEIANTLQRQSLPEDLAAGIVFLKGTCAYRQQMYKEAIRYFREVIADPNAGDYRDRSWYQLAWAYYLSDQLESAAQECQNLLQQTISTSMNSNVHYLLGQTYAKQKKYTEAVSELQTSRMLEPKGEYAQESLYLIGDLLYRLDQYAESGKTFEQFFETYQSSPRAKEALSWACNAYFADKNYPEAIRTADRLLQEFPDFENKEETIYRKALAQYQLKQYKEALKTFEELNRVAENKARKSEAIYWRAYIYELLGDRVSAASAYGCLLKEFPDFKNKNEVIMRKALCEYHEKNFDPAFQGFLSLLETETASKLPSEVIFWMIFYADEQKEHEQALQISEIVLTLFDQSSVQERACIAKGNQLVALKQWKETVHNADTFLNKFPESDFKPEIFWSKAKALEGLGQKEKSLELYEKSLAEYQKVGSPDATFEADLYMDRGRLLESLDRPGEALESFLRVAIIYDHPTLTPEAMYRGIRCHLAVDETNEAKILYNELIQNYSESEWKNKAEKEFGDKMNPKDG